MALITAEGFRDEGLNEREDLLGGVLASADRNHVRIVVLAGQHGGVVIPHEGRANAIDLVGRDLFTIAGPADDDAEGTRVGDDTETRLDTKRRIVILRIVSVRTMVDNLVPQRA